MKKIKLKINIFLIATIFLFSIVPVMAFGISSDNITINIPPASGFLNGATASWNISLDAGFTVQNWTSATVYLQSAGLTANTTEILIATAVNTTTADLEINGTLDSTRFEDGTDYTFKVQLFNGSDRVNATITGITIDNTIPQASTSLSPVDNNIDTDGTVNFTGTVVGVNTTSCTLQFVGTNFGGASQAMTHNGNSCSLQLTAIPEQSYKWFIRASDGSNTTDSSTLTVNIDSDSGTAKIVALLEEPGVRSTGGATLSFAGGFGGSTGGIPNMIIIIVVILGISWWIWIRK